MDVPELSLPQSAQLEQIRMSQLLVERITAVARSLVGSNKCVDVVTYRISASQDPDYAAELIEHIGPYEARSLNTARGGRRNTALWLLLDAVERELDVTMSMRHNGTIHTRRLGNHRCVGCGGECGGPGA